MIRLKRQLEKIDEQKNLYRILLNRSRYRQALEDHVWATAADLTSRFDLSVNSKVDEEQQKSAKGLMPAFETVRRAPKHQLDVPFIIDTHAQALAFVNTEACGYLRTMRARWLNSTMIVANPVKIPYLLDQLVEGVNQEHVPAFYWDERPDRQFQKYAKHPVMQAIETNYNLVAIHPFSDGNKRIARLMTAWVLDKYGYIPLSVYNRSAYIAGIENYFDTRRPHGLYHVMLDQMRQSYDQAICEARALDRVCVEMARRTPEKKTKSPQHNRALLGIKGNGNLPLLHRNGGVPENRLAPTM